MSPSFVMDKVRLLGDTHANLEYFEKQIRRAKRDGFRHILQLGDLNFHSYGVPPGSFEESLDGLLASYGVQLMFIDGNHDNARYLYSLPRTRQGLSMVSDNIAFIPRGTLGVVAGAPVLFMGGAASVGWHRFQEGVNWWPNESPLTVEDIFQAISRVNQARLSLGRLQVVSHEAPYGIKQIEHLIDNWRRSTDEEILACRQQRFLLEHLMVALRPSHWFHGHYHTRYVDRLGFNEFGDTTAVFGLGSDTGTLEDGIKDLGE